MLNCGILEPYIHNQGGESSFIEKPNRSLPSLQALPENSTDVYDVTFIDISFRDKCLQWGTDFTDSDVPPIKAETHNRVQY